MSDITCFVIVPIGDEGSDIRRHADWLLDGIINPALERVGLTPGGRADKIATPGYDQWPNNKQSS